MLVLWTKFDKKRGSLKLIDNLIGVCARLTTRKMLTTRALLLLVTLIEICCGCPARVYLNQLDDRLHRTSGYRSELRDNFAMVTAESRWTATESR